MSDIAFYFDTSKTCCFSGHRPEKLIGNGDVNDLSLRRILSILDTCIEEAIKDGYDCFLSGMAKGVDLWAARLITEKKIKIPNLKLVAVIPYKNQSASYSASEKWEYNNIINKADQVIVLQDKYTKDCMKRRNYYMVDHSSKLIAVVKAMYSGTGQTINYAKKQGLDIRTIDVLKNQSLFL